MTLVDTRGRRINYLRLSVTDRCNLRCRYCMPPQGITKMQHEEVLSYEDMFRIASAAVDLGVEKIRVTGGEPLVRKGVVDFLGRLAKIPGLRELVLTTNGHLLREMAIALRRSGVQRLNISLDSLRSATFARITRGGSLQHVLDGIVAAEEAGFPPVKINMVVMRGINDDELLDFAALTLDRGYTVRFIEYMPAVRDEERDSLYISGGEILERIERHFPLLPLLSPEMAGPARNYKIRGAVGALGVITPISGHFCDSCNRIRVTSAGLARSCLFMGKGGDLKPSLRSNDDGLVRETLRTIVFGKPDRHRLAEGEEADGAFAMSSIGG